MSTEQKRASQAAPEAPPEFYIQATSSLAERRPRTLKHDDTFALFDHYGDLVGTDSPDGIYYEDTRFLSHMCLTLENVKPLLLSSTVQSNNAVLDVDLTNPDIAANGRLVLRKDTIHLTRVKFLYKASCYELLAVRNFGETRCRLRIGFEFDADFADLFEVRGHRRYSRGAVTPAVTGRDSVRFDYASLDGVPRATEITFEPAPLALSEHRATYELDLQPKTRRVIFTTVHCHSGDNAVERRFFTAVRAARRALRRSLHRAAHVETSNTIVNDVLARAMADINMLVTNTPYGPYPYAGIPWFSTAFGRDGLITAIETLWSDPALARGVLQFLTAYQATTEDQERDAEPGKILHETRKCELARLGEVPFGCYYGSIDSTPLYVVLAGLYWRRTGDRATIEDIWPNIKAALTWIDRYGDSDGDGFVEYKRRSDGGLANQGWKDSEDAVFHANGQLAEPPIALCEVQGYVYLARVLAAQLANEMDEIGFAIRLREQARQLQEQFEAQFWSEELGSYVLALDGAKRQCKVRSSNAGQLLFTGIASPERGMRMAELLMTREFFTGWGIRTISSHESRFNPASYHNGSVWPHDNALIALGLAQYGALEALEKVTTGLFEAAAHMDLLRLPELFCGMHRRPEKGPTLYPIACSPQAWAAAAPLALLRACLGMTIDGRERRVLFRHPRLPAVLDWMRIRHLTVGDARLDILFRRHGDDVAVNVLNREGQADVQVVL
ncbi:MAG TPA: glycogen debranching N-terminal domain-containing protein [Steroidobacteraceae bacterium]|jgi:glycogen debranching enzyme|nr:glycogen debranching N-terminal domain-containing protein [Steroidobacteraceae bacterium]